MIWSIFWSNTEKIIRRTILFFCILSSFAYWDSRSAGRDEQNKSTTNTSKIIIDDQITPQNLVKSNVVIKTFYNVHLARTGGMIQARAISKTHSSIILHVKDGDITFNKNDIELINRVEKFSDGRRTKSRIM